MSYNEAMEAAGAEVHEFKYFGSYQGDWYAKVTYNGQKYWVHGSYGSCSGCDSFDAEFDYYDQEHCEEHKYESNPPDCEDCKTSKELYQKRLAEFGKRYLVSGEMTQEEAIAHASRNLEWDSEASEIVEFLKTNTIA